MAKRGEIYRWRVRYRWENGVKGTVVCMDRDQAEARAEEIRHSAEVRDMVVSVEIVEVTP